MAGKKNKTEEKSYVSYEKTWTRNKDVDEMMRERGEGGYDDASMSEEEALFE